MESSDAAGTSVNPIVLEASDIAVNQGKNSNGDVSSVGTDAEAQRNDSTGACPPVDPVEDEKQLDPEEVMYNIKTLRCGKVIKVPVGVKYQPLTRKTRKVNETLGANKTSKGAKNTRSRSKKKSLVALSDESKNESSKNVEESENIDINVARGDESQILSGVSGDKLGQETEIPLNQKSVDEDSSSKGSKPKLLFNPGDGIHTKMTIKEIISKLKTKNKDSPAKDIENVNNSSTASVSCNLVGDVGQNDNIRSDQNTPTKRRRDDETGSKDPDAKEIQPLKEEKASETVKRRTTKRARSQRTRLEPMQATDSNDMEEPIINRLEPTDNALPILNKADQCNVEAQCGLDATETNPVLVVSKSSDLLPSSGENYCAKPVPKRKTQQRGVLTRAAKLNLLSRSESEIQEIQPDGSSRDEHQTKEINKMSESFIQTSEELRNIKGTEDGQSKESGLCSETNDIKSSVADVDTTFKVREDPPATEAIDVEGDYCEGNFQHQPAKLPLTRKVMCPTTQEELLHATDSEASFNALPTTSKSKPSDVWQWGDVATHKRALEDLAHMLEHVNLKGPSSSRIRRSASPRSKRNPQIGRGKKSSVPATKGGRRSRKPRSAPALPPLPETPDGPKSPVSPEKVAESAPIENQREQAPPPPIIKGILKPPVLPCPTACGCAQCASIRARSYRASEFSRRQMRDIDSLATKLIGEVKSLRTIVEETAIIQDGQSCTLSSNFTVEERKAAVANAAELEETAKKWISMMSRDCNRFCKIMRPNEKKQTFTNDLQRRKKIRFADEAGGDLYEVAFYNPELEDLYWFGDEGEEVDMEEEFEGAANSAYGSREGSPTADRTSTKINFWEEFGAKGDSEEESP